MQEVFTLKPIRLHCLSECGGRMTNPQCLLRADRKIGGEHYGSKREQTVSEVKIPPVSDPSLLTPTQTRHNVYCLAANSNG